MLLFCFDPSDAHALHHSQFWFLNLILGKVCEVQSKIQHYLDYLKQTNI